MERLTTRNSEGVAVLKTPYQCERCGDEIYRLADCGSGEPIEKIARLEDLQEQGRLLELPCAAGDTVWKIKNGKISKWVVDTIKIEGSGVSFCNAVYICGLSDFGKTVFLTKEEAEEALKRMEDGK